jgi:nucleoid DNA-binding protein
MTIILTYILNEVPFTMTITKAKIVESAKDQTGFPKNSSLKIVETLLEVIKAAIV